jgi:hypothetical protein
MKKYLLIANLICSLQLLAQGRLMFDTSEISPGTILIGRYPHYDKQKTYQSLNFIIEDPATIKHVIRLLTVGTEGENTIEEPGFNISLVQHFEEGKSWIINPSLLSAMYDGHTYAFDINKVKDLARRYPFDYRFDKVPFKSKEAYRKYRDKQKENNHFLFDYSPQFEYEGSFEVQFPRNEKFSSPKAISDYLEPIIEQIVPKDTYRVSYDLNDKNLNDQSQFTMTITGTKKLFAELGLPGLKKGEWTPTVEEGWFFYRAD